jgi:hypothetical protein
MMVSISIFAIITAVVLIRNNEFNSGILFSNLVYEIALSIREMQTYGITVKASDTGTFKNGYGVYFNKSETEKSSLVQFIDKEPADNLYLYPDESEKLFKLKLKPGNFIQDITVCVSSSCNPVNDVSITYMRPDPNATIRAHDGVGALMPVNPAITKAIITIQAPGTDTIVRKCIVVTAVGQISVQNPNGTTCTP